MSMTSMVIYSVWGFCGVPKEMGRFMTLTGSIRLLPKPYRDFVSSLSCFLSLFLSRLESRVAHGCGEQWHTRVYTGLGLGEDKNPTSCVRQLYYDSLG
jgi:hypothetical protein